MRVAVPVDERVLHVAGQHTWKGGRCQLKTNICLLLVIKAGLPLMYVFARFQVVERNEADC